MCTLSGMGFSNLFSQTVAFNSVFLRAKVFNVDKVQFVNFFFQKVCFWCCLRTVCLVLDPEYFLFKKIVSCSTYLYDPLYKV